MKRFRLIVFALLFGSGCATIGGKSNRVLRLHTTPDYAKAVVNEKEYGANSTVELEGMGPYTIQFKKDGYETQTIVLDPELNGYFFWNLVLGPLFPVGMIVDAISGAIHTVKDPDVRVTLKALVRAPVVVEPVVPAVAGDPKKVIAVMPVDVASTATIGAGIKEALTDQLRVQLGTRGIRVIDRGTQERVLAEIVRDEQARSYDACTDENCQIPLGKALAATHILRAGLSKFGRMCAMTAELIALRESVTVEASTARGDCTEEGLLDTATKLIAGIK